MPGKIVRFDRPASESETARPSRVLEGDPVTRSQNLYTSADERFFAGIWESTPGKWRVRYEEEEFCVILSGRIVLTDESGAAERFGPGDAFIIPAGFSGIWETVEAVRKLYAIRLPGE